MIRPIVFALATMFVATPVAADPKAEAKAHIEKARVAHADGKFDVALAELTAAYKLDPNPQLLFGIGQVHMKLGDCATAMAYYEKFLDTHPKANQVNIVEQAIERCRAKLAAKPETKSATKLETRTVKPEPPPSRPAPVVPTAAPSPSSSAITRPAPSPVTSRESIEGSSSADWVGYGLVTGGLAATTVGIGLYRSALQLRDDADSAGSYQAFDERLGDARSRRNVSYIVIGAGGALVIGGVVHLLLHDRGGERPPVALAPVTGGAVASFGGTW